MSGKFGISAVCTWGDGPDMVLSIKGKSVILMEEVKNKDKWVHGTVSVASLDLTSHEARELSRDLLMAAARAEELEDQCEAHDDMS